VREIKRRGAEVNSLLEHGEDPFFFLLSPPLFFLSEGMGGWSRQAAEQLWRRTGTNERERLAVFLEEN
jgi:hypothetical protein